MSSRPQNSPQPEAGAEVPRHVAIIMDGNNRWAQQRKLRGVAAGHRAGVEAIRSVLAGCERFGVEVLTLFAFSSENWARPRKEVEALMTLFSSYLDAEVKGLHERGMRVRFIGRRDRFSKRICERMAWAEGLTAANQRGTLVIAADYGGQWDVCQAAAQLAEAVAAGELAAGAIDTEVFNRYTSMGDLPGPDLLIRTGGDHRISNFLLWQCAYTEFYFTETFWPDFGEAELARALADFGRRERRFGRTSEQVGASGGA